MLEVIEDTKNEFKLNLTNKLESEVVAFLNTDGGNIYIGINDKSEIIGFDKCEIDLLQRKIKDKLINNISPSVIGLFKIIVEKKDNKFYIKIEIKRGDKRPYYLEKIGMTSKGCFIRVGSSIQPMPQNMIMGEFSKRVKSSLIKLESPTQELTFSQLKIYYEEKNFKIEDNFYEQLHFYNEEKKFNYLAYLLSDNNWMHISFGKYKDTNMYDLIELEEYGSCSLITATKRVLEKFKIENTTYTKVEYPERKEIKKYDYDAIREAVINAMVHNTWTREAPPKFEMFTDRIVITSIGGLQENVSENDFLEGKSLPVNPELMKVFKDLELVEEFGTGIKRILKSYDKSCFDLSSKNFLTVTFPFNRNELRENDNEEINIPKIELTEIQKAIIKLMSENSKITQVLISNFLRISRRTVQRNIKELIDLNIIVRLGSNRSGEWIVNKHE